MRSTDARRLWRRTVDEFDLQEHHLALLEQACKCVDRLVEARDVLDRDGITTTDRYGAQKQHPAIAVERDSRIALARLVRDLGLDVEPSGQREPGRSW